MTLPSVVRLLLMLAPSFSRVPFAPVDSARSDPARSTSEILLTFSAVSPDAWWGFMNWRYHLLGFNT